MVTPISKFLQGTEISSFTFESFKSFIRPSTISFAPLTLLFGHNSAGKSSCIRKISAFNFKSPYHGLSSLNNKSRFLSSTVEFKNLILDKINVKVTWIGHDEYTYSSALFIHYEFFKPGESYTHSVYCLRDITFAGENIFKDIDEDGIKSMLHIMTEGKFYQFLDRDRSRRLDQVNSVKIGSGSLEGLLLQYQYREAEFRAESTWTICGSHRLEDHLMNLAHDQADPKKQKIKAKEWKELKKQFPGEFDKYSGVFKIPRKSRLDSRCLRNVKDAMGLELSLWFFKIKAALEALEQNVYHLGPLRERPAQSYLRGRESDTVPYINRYLRNDGQNLWPLISDLRKEDSDVLQEVNIYLTVLGANVLLTRPANEYDPYADGYDEPDSEDIITYEKRLEQLRDLLTPDEFDWLSEKPNSHPIDLSIWRNLDGEIKLRLEDEMTKLLHTPKNRNTIQSKIELARKYTAILESLLAEEAYQNNKTYVAISDVGSGISQVLPVLINLALCRKDSKDSKGEDKPKAILITEQPELHLHPKAQADLADLFIQSLFEDDECTKLNGQMHVIETHSELLMLRIKKRVAEGILKPDDVAINYVWQDQEGSSHIKHIRLDHEGNFIDSWPHGFFEESFNETLRD
jgi:predicted ATPase